ncbi:MAG: alpha/beta hydrolase-fold protein [Colwellia sp.]|nr:alpha/beta hydrolase-fold protein [Colwellia sp.]
MLRLFISVIFIFTLGSSNAVDAEKGTTENAIMDPRITEIDEPIIIAKKFTFSSEILGNERTFYVHLPKGYHQSNQSYPVLFITDGERKTLRIASVTHELSYFAKRIPPMIVVGIANDGTRRENLSLLPSSMQFLSFITKELKPYIHQQYRTNDENLFLGSSAGGQFAIRALLETPEEFDAYFAISPSLYYNDYHLEKKAKELALTKQQLDKTLYLSLGNEGIVMGVDEFALNLAKYPIKGLRWTFTKVEEETHGSISMKQAYNGLQNYYSSWAPTHFNNVNDFERKGGLAALKAKYENETPAVVPFKVLNSIANLYFYSNYYQQGIELALLNIKNHPNSIFAKYNLAEFYGDIDNHEKALNYYQQALDIATLNKNPKRVKTLKQTIEKYKLKLN